MKKALSHLPKRKRDELKRIVEVIRNKVDDLQMLILFGSHARSDWVEDIYTKNQTTYEYISDFDILAIVEARYDPDYRITKKQLEYLAERVKKLQKLTKTVCEAKIKSFT